MKNKVDIQFPEGNEAVKSYLQRMAEEQTVAHSLLFMGPESAPKLALAKAFASLLISKADPAGIHVRKLAAGVHPDLHILRPEGKLGLHSMESLRQFIAEVALPPLESQTKVFIIEEAHRMWPYSANALLKTLEEPPHDTVIILVTHMSEALLPTILSRCRTVRIRKEGVAVHKNPVLLPLFQKTQFNSYKEFQQAIKGIAESLEKKRKEIEETSREELTKWMAKDLNAAQKQALEKSIESLSSMAVQVRMDEIFEEILAWYRDLHLIDSKGDAQYLYFPAMQAELLHALKRGDLLPLERVQEAVCEAKLALERSLPIAHCLENLCLKTRLVP